MNGGKPVLIIRDSDRIAPDILVIRNNYIRTQLHLYEQFVLLEVGRTIKNSEPTNICCCAYDEIGMKRLAPKTKAKMNPKTRQKVKTPAKPKKRRSSVAGSMAGRSRETGDIVYFDSWTDSE